MDTDQKEILSQLRHSEFSSYKRNKFKLDKHEIRRPIDYCKDVTTPEDERSVFPMELPILYRDFNEAFQHYCASNNVMRKKIFNTALATPIEKNNMSRANATYLKLYKKKIVRFEQDLRNMTQIKINASKETIEAFTKYLCEVSHLGRSNKVNENHNKKVLFLTGELGEGKSFLINYILTSYQDEIFEKKKVITVKVDLASIHQEEASLEEKIYKKLIKILKTKYFVQVREQVASRLKVEDLVCYLEKTSQTEFNFVIDEINKVDLYGSIDLQGQELKNAYRILKNFVSYYEDISTHNYRFLIIIDGLDNYNRDLRSGSKFFNRIKELKKHVINKEFKDHCYLIVARHESHSEILEQSDLGAGNSLSPFKHATLFPVEPEDVFQKKIKVFQSFLELTIKQNKDIGEEEKIIILIKEKIESFTNLILELVKNVFLDKKKVPVTIEDYFNKNLREIVKFYNVVTRTFFHFLPFFSLPKNTIKNQTGLYNKLDFLLTTKNKELINYFYSKHAKYIFCGVMNNQLHFALDQYQFTIKKKDKFIHTQINISYSKRLLLTNIFQIEPILLKYLNKNEFVPYMIKVRILQLFYFYSKKDVVDSYTFDHISKKMNQFFGFKYDIVFGVCHMLYSEQCLERDIKSKHRYRVVKDGKSYGRFMISNKGKLTLNHLMYKIDYIFNLLDNIYLEKSYCKFFFNPCNSIVLDYQILLDCSPGEIKSQMQRVKEQYILKLVQLNSLIKFYKLVEARQKAFYLNKTDFDFFSFDKKDEKDTLLVWDKIENHFSKTVKNEFSNHDENEKNNSLFEHLSEYITHKN